MVKQKIKSVLRVFLACSGNALAVPLLHSCFDPGITPGYLIAGFLESLVYSNCIGGLLFTVLPPLWSVSRRWPFVFRWLGRLGVLFMATVVGCLVAGLILFIAEPGNFNYWKSFAGSLKISLILAATASAFIVMLETYRSRLQATAMDLHKKELDREKALKLATEARLSSLESRIHPHFLFNTINSISSLIPEDPKRAEDMLMQMADLLRFSIDSASLGLVPLQRELKIVGDYLDIEKTRFTDRLCYELQIAEEILQAHDVNQIYVPPLSLQTLAENSIKYAVNSRLEGARIRVFAEKSTDRWTLGVWDDGPGFPPIRLPDGHGLHNLQERLSAVFGDEGQLRIRSTAGNTTVSFMVPHAMIRREKQMAEADELIPETKPTLP